MDTIISNLVQRFESGSLTRRELIQGLTMIAAAGGTAAAGAQAPSQAPVPHKTGFKGLNIDHMSIQVNDLPRSIAFYQNLFGFSIVSEDKKNEIVRLGINKTVVSLHHKNPTNIVDHFAIAVDPFNQEAVTKDLKALGLTPDQNIDWGFYVKDPEGIPVQIVKT
jgi:catechol 2,3-dioxygenase-like lactoylglutathione lyase family enzyme